MKVRLAIRPASKLTSGVMGGEGIYIMDVETNRPVAHMKPWGIGYKHLDEDQETLISQAVISAALELEFDIPGSIEDYIVMTPAWADIGAGTRRVVSGGGGRGSPGEIRIPPNAKFEANGEIHVPPRSDDSKHPDNKSFRRACRKARNAIRDLAAKEGKTVEFIMAGLMEKK